MKIDSDLLCCEHCGEINLHQHKISMFCRDEDKDVQHIIIDAISGQIEEGIDRSGRNPSSRRQGMIISFYCEHCDYETDLLIGQHKGVTEIRTVARKIGPHMVYK